MSVQGALPFPDPANRPDTIQARFEAFHEANPHVYAIFRKFAEEALASGMMKYSADAILHRLRWHMNIEVRRTGGEMFKINDHYSSRYGRKLAAEDARFRDFFDFRDLRSA